MIKLQNKLQKIYHADYNLLIAQDLQQTHYQILPIIFLKEFIKLNVNNKHEKKKKKNKKNQTCGIKHRYYDSFLEYTKFKDDLTEFICLCWNKNYQQKFHKKLTEQFFNTYKFSNHDNNKFVFLLWKGVYPYEYMDDWKKLNETSIPNKKVFTVT